MTEFEYSMLPGLELVGCPGAQIYEILLAWLEEGPTSEDRATAPTSLPYSVNSGHMLIMQLPAVTVAAANRLEQRILQAGFVIDKPEPTRWLIGLKEWQTPKRELVGPDGQALPPSPVPAKDKHLVEFFAYETIGTIPSAPIGEPANWEPHRGNNHLRLLPAQVHAGGVVNFGRHIGKPLSDALWEDLRHRIGMTHLCIYGPDAEEWLMGWGPGHCTIRLDAEENVRAIEFVPYFPPTGI